MKKSKILIPVLSIAGLGAVAAPLVAMTSCGCTPPGISDEDFKKLVEEITTAFNNPENHNTFEPSEITMKKNNVVQPILGVSQFSQNEYRRVEVHYENKESAENDSDYEISATKYFEEIDYKVSDKANLKSKTYNNFDDYIKAVIVTTGDKAGTFEYEIYKNGFLKSYKATYSQSNGGGENKAVEMSYSAEPHAVANFNIELSASEQYSRQYIRTDADYTVTFKLGQYANNIKKFCVSTDEPQQTRVMSGCHIYKPGGTEELAGWAWDSTNKWISSTTALTAGETYVIKFVTYQTGYLYLNFASN